MNSVELSFINEDLKTPLLMCVNEDNLNLFKEFGMLSDFKVIETFIKCPTCHIRCNSANELASHIGTLTCLS